MDIDFQDGLIVNGDRDHVFRAVYNLVDNAVKFINTDGKLTLRAHAEGTMCAFSIKNTGAGIAPRDIPHVFDRFYKPTVRAVWTVPAPDWGCISSRISSICMAEIFQCVRMAAKPSFR